MKIVMISGKQGSGKTTLQYNLIKMWEQKGLYGFEVNFADVLYEMHDEILEILNSYWPKRDIVKDGPLLQLLGTEWGRKTVDENIWVKIMQKRLTMSPFNVPGSLVVIGDCRFENEFDGIPDALRVRLRCERDIRKERCEMWRDNENHPSEVGLDRYDEEEKFDMYFNTSNLITPKECATLIMAQLDKNVWKEKRK